MSAKMGRPTTNPKNGRISIRLDETAENILIEYCNSKNVSKGEAIRNAILKLRSDLE